MKSRICDKLRYREKPLQEIAEGVTVEVNNKAMALLEAAELADSDINKATIDKMTSLLYSEEDAAKIAALDLTFEDFMIVISESIRAVIGQSGNDEKN